MRQSRRCEVPWCRQPGVDHHHIIKPRASHHTAALVVHICRQHHEQTERPYFKGRLDIAALGTGAAQEAAG